MFKKLYVMSLCLVFSMTLVGCNVNQTTDVFMEQNTKRVAEIKEDYKTNTTNGVNLESSIKEKITKNVEITGIENYISPSLSVDDFNAMLTECHELYMLKLEDLTRMYHRTNGCESDCEPTEEEYKTVENMLLSNVSTNYFLDKSVGSTEQYIIFRLSDKILKISINWLGGVVYDHNYEVR